MKRTLSVVLLLLGILPAWAGENEITPFLPQGGLSPGTPQKELLGAKEAPEAGPDLWDESRFFDKSREGWFWYLEMRKEEKREALEKKTLSGPLPPTLVDHGINDIIREGLFGVREQRR